MDALRDQHGLIDVKRLIERYSPEEHRAQADAYFASHPDDTPLLRKPFQGMPEAGQITQGVSLILRELKLFAGARVLDFGAGTAWLSKILAYLRCEAIAVDLSQAALELGRKANSRDMFADQLKISYLPYDGVRIPLGNDHVDRICCFDAFHHVADQRATLAEFFRVLKPGGIAAFHEPGPFHSRSPDSQSEMEKFNVIENDIFIEEIDAMARAIGFEELKVAWYVPTPILLDVPKFNRVIGGQAAPDEERMLLARAAAELQNMRIFFLYKPGAERVDSRFGSGLKAGLDVRVTRSEKGMLTGSVTARNIGSAVWLPSGSGAGDVNVGVHLLDAEGKVVNMDYARIVLSANPVAPGESRVVDFSIGVPGLATYTLAFDLVSEQVAWFELKGSEPVLVSSADLQRP